MTANRMPRLIGGALLGVAMTLAGCSSTTVEAPTETSKPATEQTSQQQAPATTASNTVAPTSSMMPNPNGDGSMVPCEGTICTNPNHGAGDAGDADAPPEPGQTDMQGPDGSG